MTTAKLDHTDPTSMALAIKGLQGDQALLSRDVSTNISNLTSSTQALQADVRHLTDQITEVTRLQQQAVSHSEGLNRAFIALEKLTTRIEGWIDKHEIENRGVADTVTDFKGRFRGVWMAGALVVFLGSATVTLAWNQVNEKFTGVIAGLSDAKSERVALEARRQAIHDADVARLQQQIDRTAAALEASNAVRGLR